MPPIENGLALVLAIMFGALVIGSCIRGIALWRARTQSPEWARQRRASLLGWWVLSILFSGALLMGRAGLAVLLCIASLLALREFHQIFTRRSIATPALAVTLSLLTTAHYLAIGFTQSSWVLRGFPVIAMMLLTATVLLTGRTADYLRTAAGYYWAAMLMVFGLSHVIAASRLPVVSHDWSAGVIGWSLYLVLLTEVNDISQANIGRLFEKRHSLSPVFSPKKSWEGFIGGFVVTMLLAAMLAPWLTSFHEGRSTAAASLLSVAAGAIIATCGLMGDLNMSGLKRDAGVKDSSSLLPGMGGMIDRIDSLTMAAPAFYYFALWVTTA